jgi:hypothetical protein
VGPCATRGPAYPRSLSAAGKPEVDVTLEQNLNEGKHGVGSDALLTGEWGKWRAKIELVEEDPVVDPCATDQ